METYGLCVSCEKCLNRGLRNEFWDAGLAALGGSTFAGLHGVTRE